MRYAQSAVVATALLLLACSEQSDNELPFEPQAAMQGQAPVYLVTFREGVDVTGTARELARLHGFTVRHVREHAAKGFSAVIPDARLRQLQNDPRIELIEADGPVALIRPVGGEQVTTAAVQTTPWGI